MALRSHYELLGVAPDADADAIKFAYRKLTKDTHPDRPTGTNGLFGLITDVYDELRDPVSRAAYDRKLARGETRAPDPPAQQDQRPSTTAEEARSAEEAQAAEEARAAAEAQRARDQAVAARRRERERQRHEEQRKQDEQKAAARARDAAEQSERNYLRFLMAVAVFVGFIASYNLEHYVRASRAIYLLPADRGMPVGVATFLVVRASLMLLMGGLLIGWRNYMAKLKPWEVAGICVTWSLVTALVRPPHFRFYAPVVVFLAIMGTGVYARWGRRSGAPPTAPPGTTRSRPRDPPPFRSPKAPPSEASGRPAPATSGNRRPTVASRCPGCGKMIQPNAWILHPRYCVDQSSKQSADWSSTDEPSPPPHQPTATPGNGRPTVASRCPGCGKTIQPNARILHPRYCAGRT